MVRSEPLVGSGGRLVTWVEGDNVQVGAVHLDVAARRVHGPQQVQAARAQLCRPHHVRVA